MTKLTLSLKRNPRIALEHLSNTKVLLAVSILLGQLFATLEWSHPRNSFSLARSMVKWGSIQGPAGLEHSPLTYSFPTIQRSFGGRRGLEVARLEEFSSRQVEEMMLQVMPLPVRKNAHQHLAWALKMAERHQVDPLWVVAVIWTESHFVTDALSSKGAIGPMQIMPETWQDVGRRMGHPLDEDLSELQLDPALNIEMGVFYLKHLLTRFRGNYTLATVAYNMGPSTVRRRLRQKLPVGVSNNYLNKVRAFYSLLSRPFIEELALRSAAANDKLVVLDDTARSSSRSL
jgi:soluble lytic murein transglycosylase